MDGVTEDERYIYETKCRRCGSMAGWAFNPINIDPEEFLVFMQDRVEHPRQCRCATCNMDTVQEVTYFWKPL